MIWFDLLRIDWFGGGEEEEEEMSSKKEEERNEKVIRGLMKLPPNRRCINCNSLVIFIFSLPLCLHSFPVWLLRNRRKARDNFLNFLFNFYCYYYYFWFRWNDNKIEKLMGKKNHLSSEFLNYWVESLFPVVFFFVFFLLLWVIWLPGLTTCILPF